MTTKTLITPFLLSNGFPALGLASTSVNIRDANSGELIISGGLLEELGDGFYKYVFSEYTSSVNYAIRFDGTSALGAGRYTFAANEHFSEDIWSQDMTAVDSSIIPSGSNTPVSTAGHAINAIYNIQYGRWKVNTTTNEMIFFKPDNATEIARFSLLDSSGSSSINDVFERVRNS